MVIIDLKLDTDKPKDLELAYGILYVIDPSNREQQQEQPAQPQNMDTLIQQEQPQHITQPQSFVQQVQNYQNTPQQQKPMQQMNQSMKPAVIQPAPFKVDDAGWTE